MTTLVKICGLNTPESMEAALDGDADFVGIVFHPTSPRYVDIEVAAYLAKYVPVGVKIVGLFVDPDDTTLQKTLNAVRLDMIQLHGHENPGRVKEIKQKFGLPVMKALSLSSKSDLTQIDHYKDADWILIDAPGGGGTGRVFDWSYLDGFESPKPWMLAGGLTESNVAQAISLLRPTAIDVSSGVESSRGVKDVNKIKAFLKAAKCT